MNEKKIYDYLVKSGLTPAGACGLMGNLYAESGMKSVCLELLCIKRYKERRGITYTSESYMNDVDSGKISKQEFLNPMGLNYGWGLVQWTTPLRKSSLYDRCKALKKSIGDLDTQLSYLLDELKSNFKGVYHVLTTTENVLDASNVVLKQFECPADTGTAVQNQRLKYSMNYYQQFKDGETVTVNDILKIFQSWIGLNEYDGSFRQIIDIYNSHKPLARGYKVQYTDAWCDATVSAAFIKANAVSAIGGTECGVQEHIQLFKKAGIWLGRTKPQSGDLICYDWKGDGYADHIGIVESVNGSTITTIEGNYQDSVKRRVILYNDAQICGYARPKYDSSSNEITASEPADKFDKSIAGTYVTKQDANMRNGASSKKYSVMVKIPGGAKVQNYGYYSLNGSAKWLYVQYKTGDKTYTGFVSSGLLQKQ